ncbi:hypothetical protein OHS58_47470 [Amycolatopsis sp. NBC_00348]|uniref:hypothetical protein n=1 Tax=Amycolatopsis sp. NBC_00348 TaxID=2975956 RepID=UPI002E266E83
MSCHTALLNDLHETQIEQCKQLDSLGTDLGSLGTTIDKGFADLNARLEGMIRLLQQVVDKD